MSPTPTSGSRASRSAELAVTGSVADLPPYPPRVLQQFVEGSAELWNRRRTLVVSPAVHLARLLREDQRLSSYIEALHLAGPPGKAALLQAFASLGFGEAFPAATIAIESQDVVMLERIANVTRVRPELETAFLAAFAWVSGGTLAGLVRRLFGIDPFWRRVSLAACGEHRVAPIAWITEALAGEKQLRHAALRVAGEGGALESLPEVRGTL